MYDTVYKGVMGSSASLGRMAKDIAWYSVIFQKKFRTPREVLFRAPGGKLGREPSYVDSSNLHYLVARWDIDTLDWNTQLNGKRRPEHG